MSTPTTVPSTPTIEPGQVVGGRYVLLAPVGRGGSGSVWRAHDQLLDRDVAVKRLRGGSALDAVRERMIRERAHREGRVAARLHHPRLAAIYDMSELDGEVCLVMEYLDAPSLADLLHRDGPLPAARVAAIGAQIAEGLAAMHERGIVHRDIKPGNVMIGPDDTVTVTDFGIAVIDAELGAGDRLFAGTPRYMAPELVRGDPPTAAADLFSLGATLHTALLGTPPPDGGDPALEPAAAGVRPTHDPQRLGQALRALLEHDPQRRPSATAAARLLTAAAESSPGPAGRSSAAERPDPPVGAHRRTEIATDGDAARSGPMPLAGVPAPAGGGSPATPEHRTAPGHVGGRHRAVLAASWRPSRRVVGVVAGLAGVFGAAGLVTLAAEPRQEPPPASSAAPLAALPLPPAAGPPIVPVPPSSGTPTSVEEVVSAASPRSETSRSTAARAAPADGDDSAIAEDSGGDGGGGGGTPKGHGNGNGRGNGNGNGNGRGHGG
ncbi:protein kinase [Actinomycetospora lutea]|uniref:serine/threonine-protein kinase n=1 Tax=Actinomycetospora lutea TaxID=663604 RepID=UPI002367281D|nr:serine/threonine-protein kinase [Actinomycetospora lutea]MDD7937961.1 protein kinase [Actinomycetospora lutea]